MTVLWRRANTWPCRACFPGSQPKMGPLQSQTQHCGLMLLRVGVINRLTSGGLPCEPQAEDCEEMRLDGERFTQGHTVSSVLLALTRVTNDDGASCCQAGFLGPLSIVSRVNHKPAQEVSSAVISAFQTTSLGFREEKILAPDVRGSQWQDWFCSKALHFRPSKGSLDSHGKCPQCRLAWLCPMR